MKQVVVYHFKRKLPLLEMKPEWGTLDAISNMRGCVPVTRSARCVRADLLDADGFVPYGLTPDDLDS